MTTRLRYIAKVRVRGRKPVWGVYDVTLGSWPGERPGLGKVNQDHPTEQAAQDEADRITAHYAAHPEKEPR